MKVGDLVIRKVNSPSMIDSHKRVAMRQREKLGPGIVLSTQWSGAPAHFCLTVFYAKIGKTYDIAAELMEVISESR